MDAMLEDKSVPYIFPATSSAPTMSRPVAGFTLDEVLESSSLNKLLLEPKLDEYVLEKALSDEPELLPDRVNPYINNANPSPITINHPMIDLLFMFANWQRIHFMDKLAEGRITSL